MTIYVDEAGFTGNDLLNRDQPFFVLSTVTIEEDEAEFLIKDLRARFRLKATELKAKNLLKTSNGRKAVSHLIMQLTGRYALSCNDKEYNLCCKFFEYVFEPVLQKNNSLFYEKKFHLFIANTLYLFLRTQEQLAIDILLNFAEMMRQNNIDAIRRLFTAKGEPNVDEVFVSIIDFIEGYDDLILEDLIILDTNKETGKWVLDLTLSSLSSLLRHWNQSIPEMTVYCDNSKPLEASRNFFDAMVGRTDKPMIRFPGGKMYCPVFNLKEPVQFVDSKTSYGIQIADILAGTAALALKNKDQEYIAIIDDGNIEESVFPTFENIDLGKKAPFINGVVLQELANRARNNYDPLLGMREYYEIIEEMYDADPPL